MSNSLNVDFLSNFSQIFDKAKSGSSDFPNQFCEFLVDQFDYQSSVLFSVASDSFLTVAGRSAKAKKSFLNGSSVSCKKCNLLTHASSEFNIKSDADCDMQISEFVIYEGCISISTSSGERFLLRIAKEAPFSQLDNITLDNSHKTFKLLFETWLDANGGSKKSKRPFTEIFGLFASELRQSANSIIGFASILAEDNLSISQKEYVDNIKHNIKSILFSLNEANDYSKLLAGNFNDTKSEIVLEKFISNIKNSIMLKYQEYNFSFEGIDSSLGTLNFDEQKLRFIINSLLELCAGVSNSRDVKLSIIKDDSSDIKLNFSSINPGISESDLKNLFIPFGKDEIKSLKTFGLSGLSLGLAKEMIDKLNGAIGIKLNKSSLDLSLSFSKNTKPVDIKSKLKAVQNKSDNKTNDILVIEDDYATSKLLSNYLNKWGYVPTIVNNEQLVFEQLKKKKYMAVILDIELPNINGLQLLKKIHDQKETANLPVIVCSVEADEQKAYMMGAVEYFVKPINYNYLVEVLTSYKLRKNSNILCVDDDVPTLNLVKQAIETAGFKPVAEHISSNVMDLIKDKDIDLAIVDLDMPHPNGFELIKLIKSEDKFANLPIIIYTGKENFADDLKKIEGLFDTLLDKKSSNIEDLSETINRMITRYETPPPVQDVIKNDGGIKILLAEDYKHSQIIVTRLLKKNGFESIVVVENGEDALNMAKKDKFNLILMDMQMPIMNGFEATSGIRKLPEYNEVPIIALTAFAMKGDREKCLEAGATDYIPKPIDSKEFIEKVKYYTKA